MSHTVFCAKLKKEALGLERPPMATPLGDRIYKEISKEAWALWIKQQTMIINEGKFNLTDPDVRKHLVQEMEKFLFHSE